MAAGLSAGAEPADRVLVITRVLDAPRSLVFKAWTDRDHLAHWFGPRSFELTFCKMDLRPGGSYRFGMHSAEGIDHWLQGTYQEIVEPEKLVCTYAWADANGNATRPETVLALTLWTKSSPNRISPKLQWRAYYDLARRLVLTSRA